MYELCVGYGGMSPDYFCRALSLSEAEAYMKGLDKRRHDGWEQARLILCGLVSKASDLTFPWEEEREEPKTEEEQREEIERIKASVPHITQLINRHNNGSIC